MRCSTVLALLLAFAVLAPAVSDVPSHQGDPGTADATSHAAIEVLINPEARLTARRGTGQVADPQCGRAIEVTVRVENFGFVTAPLLVRLEEPVPDGVALESTARPLTGRIQETRVLRVHLSRPDPVDITLAFHTKGDIPDVGGAGSVNLLLRCRQTPEADSDRDRQRLVAPAKVDLPEQRLSPLVAPDVLEQQSSSALRARHAGDVRRQ